MVSHMRVLRADDPSVIECRNAKAKRLARVRKVVGAKVFDAQLADYYARLDAARGI